MRGLPRGERARGSVLAVAVALGLLVAASAPAGAAAPAGSISGVVAAPPGYPDGWEYSIIMQAIPADDPAAEPLTAGVEPDTGTYQFADVPAGEYLVYTSTARFTAPPYTGDYTPLRLAPEYWDGVLKQSRATPVTVAGGPVSGIDFALEDAPVFVDISPRPPAPEYTPFFEEIAWLGFRGISTGYPIASGAVEYRPLATVNRDAMAAFLYRYAGSPDFTPPAESPFLDLPPSIQFYKEICWLDDQEITTGWEVPGGREYRPLEPIARDAMAAFLYRYAGSPAVEPPTEPPFADVSTTQLFASEMAWLADAGISTGWPDGTYRPLRHIARDAMAAFLYRLDDLPS